MKHWHWSYKSNRPVSHSHKGGEKMHIHSDKGWGGYGRTKKVVQDLYRGFGKRKK